jgi:phosphate transport system protein
VDTPGKRTASDYEEELQSLREGLLAMAGRVERMIRMATDALKSLERRSIKELVAEDRQVNRAELDIDGLCLRILARRQPMGPDLRFITQALKMVADLERIGDLAVNVGERARDLSKLESSPVHPALEEMGDRARKMVGLAIDAFVEKDADKAREVLVLDDAIDELYARVFEEVLDRMRSDGEIHRGIHVQSAAKFLERIGDHAMNLAEQVVFMVDGTDIRHPRARPGKVGEHEHADDESE